LAGTLARRRSVFSRRTPKLTSGIWRCIRFAHPAREIAFDEYRQAVKDAHERVARLTQALREQCDQWRMHSLVRALMCMRGFDFVAAVTVVADVFV
jgi:hypothetical protein